MNSVPLEDTSEQRIAQTTSDMYQILDSAAKRDDKQSHRTKFTASFQDRQEAPSDRVFAESLPADHPSLQNYVSQSHGYASNFEGYGGHQGDVRRREDLRREYAPTAFFNSSAHPQYEPRWGGSGLGFSGPWQATQQQLHPALTQFDNHAFFQMQQRLSLLEQRQSCASMDFGEFIVWH